jgi:hypothetical protein
MSKGGKNFDFAQEPFRPQHGRQFRVEDLDGDRAVMLQIVSQENRGHAATAQFPLETKPIAQCVPQPTLNPWHRLSGGWIDGA